jgi:DNA-binding transcriptional LysR family regulator
MDRLGPLNAFIHAAESRSFTTAGRELGISPSAVGKAVGRLEERLGVQLFHRSTRSITLTAEGALFLKRCQTIFGEIEAAELELAQTTAAPRGKLRVSMPLIGMLMMPAISAFAKVYPEIALDLDFTDRLVDVIEEGFDCCHADRQAQRFQVEDATARHLLLRDCRQPSGAAGFDGCEHHGAAY